MAYKKVGWKDYPSTDTPINATNLDHMDAGILENAQTIGDKTKISGIGDGTVAGAIAANTAAIEQNTQSLPYIIYGSTSIAVDGNNLKEDTINVALKTGYSIASITMYGVSGAGEANILTIDKNNFSYFVKNNGVYTTTFGVKWLVNAVYTG